jgi:hypothetical protein
MDQFHNMLSRDIGAPALFYALVVVLVIVLIMWMWPSSEGVTAGGNHVFAQPYFESGGAKSEAFQARSPSGLGKVIREGMSMGPVQAQLASEGRHALLNKLGCEVDASGNYTQKTSGEAWGWLRNEANKKEGLTDNKLSAIMEGK